MGTNHLNPLQRSSVNNVPMQYVVGTEFSAAWSPKIAENTMEDLECLLLWFIFP